MATRNISLDPEAYELLKGIRRKGESFSQVIKRMMPPVNKPPAQRPIDLKKWLASIEPLSGEAIEAVEHVVAQRRAPQNMTRPWKRKSKR